MNAYEQDAVRAREEHYHEVSLRAVELLARAQRTADEAVAEAQSYARDLEESAREQYQQILLRAQAAAQQHSSAAGSSNGVGRGPAGEEAGTLDAEKLTYVRTYARVAHAQLKSVLAALNDELDQLAAMAEGDAGASPGRGPAYPSTAPGPAVGPRTPTAPQAPAAPQAPTGLPASTDVLQWPSETDESERGIGGAPEGNGSTDPAAWPPIFAATNAISYVPRGSSSKGPQFWGPE